MESPSPWSRLPKEILAMIKNLLHSPSDITRFRSVCPSWRSSTPPFKNCFPFPNILLHPISETHNYLDQIIIYRFEPLTRPSSSSPASWFVAVQVANGEHHYLNALTSFQIDLVRYELPKELNLSDFQITEIKKVYEVEDRKALFINTHYYDEPLLAVLASSLVFYKLEDTQWVMVKEIVDMTFTDVELYHDRVWGVGSNGRTVVFTSSLDTIEIVPRLLHDEEDEGAYFQFIESSGDLYLVEFNEDTEKGYRSLSKDELIPVKVYKLVVGENRMVVVRDLGDRVFVFALESLWCFSLPSRESSDGMKNCIVRSAICSDEYDSDDGAYVPMIYSVWDIEKDKYNGLGYEFRKLFWPPPNWFITGSSC